MNVLHFNKTIHFRKQCHALCSITQFFKRKTTIDFESAALTFFLLNKLENSYNMAMDAREKKTKAKILKYFESLCLEDGYDNFNMSDLIQKSDLSRSTVYSHFKKKEQILAAYVNSLFSERKEREIDYHQMLLGVFEACYLKADVLRDIMNSSAKDFLLGDFKKQVNPIMDGIVTTRLIYKEGVPEKLQQLALSESFVAILGHWLNMGCVAAPETFANYFFAIAK